MSALDHIDEKGKVLIYFQNSFLVGSESDIRITEIPKSCPACGTINVDIWHNPKTGWECEDCYLK